MTFFTELSRTLRALYKTENIIIVLKPQFPIEQNIYIIFGRIVNSYQS